MSSARVGRRAGDRPGGRERRSRAPRDVRQRAPRGAAAVGMVIVLVVLSLVTVGMVMGGARDQDQTVRRLESLRAFYAAEAGMNMGLRERMLDADEDDDGAIGTVSNDADDGNNPAIGAGSVFVAVDETPGSNALISHGSAGQARRLIASAFDAGSHLGLRARHYTSALAPATLDDIDWSATPAFDGAVSSLNFASTSGVGWPGGATNNWGRRYTGVIAIPATGTWTFSLTSDDGSKLWIDGALVVNHDGLHGMTTATSNVTLNAGAHSIEARWFERSGNFGLMLSWSGPGVPSTTVIPPSAFTH